MKRAISLYLPYWSTDRLYKQLGNTLSPEQPFVLLGRDERRRIVVAANKVARAKGITKAMPATKAQAIVADLHMQDIDVDADQSALEDLAQWALKHYSPIVALDMPDGLLIDGSGVAHLFGGERQMLQHMVDQLQAQGYVARVAIAPTFTSAVALARFGRSAITIINNAELEHVLDPLPMVGLRLAEDAVADLHKLGFERIGEVKSQPRAPFKRRLGAELGRKLNEAYGAATEFLSPVMPPDPVTVRRAFAEPIAAAETIAHYITKLIVALCLELDSRRIGARCLDLYFHRVDNTIQGVRVGLAKPTRDVKHLTKLLCSKIETVDPGFGIEIMILNATWIESLDYQQCSLNIGRNNPNDISSLIDSLSNRLRAEHVYKARPVESDVPERSVLRTAPLNADTKQTDWPKRWPRPVVLLNKPERIETIAMLPDYPPVSFTWRNQRRKVRNADGPERIFGEWWKRDPEFEALRDYFQLEDEEGSRFWVFRAGDGVLSESGSQQWFMHGFFG